MEVKHTSVISWNFPYFSEMTSRKLKSVHPSKFSCLIVFKPVKNVQNFQRELLQEMPDDALLEGLNLFRKSEKHAFVTFLVLLRQM